MTQVNLKCSINRTHIKANSPATLFVAVDINAPGSGGQSSAGSRNWLNVGLAIDCSGSMQEDNKFEFAQEAARSLVKALRPSDSIAIISFETKARVEVPLSNAQDPSYLESVIARISVGQETDLYEGLRLAWQEIAPSASRPGVISRVIVLTDGEPTHGKTKEKDFVRLADEIRQSRIPVTTIGVGPKYNERLLMSISQATGSLWYHVSSPSYMTDIFSDEVTQMALTVVQSPTLSITAREGTDISDMYTMRPMITKINLPTTHPTYSFRLKDLVAGEDQTLLLRVKIPGRPVGHFPMLRVQLGQLTSELAVDFTDDEQLANIEADPYPRMLWVAGDGLTQLQSWLDGQTKARDMVETRMRALLADKTVPTLAHANPALDTAVTKFKEVYDETTRVVPSDLSEDDKKRLREKSTVVRRTH